ncbi:extracellular solute-binding protein [Paenibacillus sp. 1P07SE]|uniref:extracellular solute-binding protein n=1 Tax=Paenibacillus sp. 1P07SE TaxID=3132209 RepID=UPI0039A61817
MMRRIQPWRKGIAPALMLSLVLAGCGGGSPSGQVNDTGAAAGSPAPAGAEQVSAPAAQQSPLVLYGNDFVDFIAPKFEEATGYAIEAVHYGGGEALAKIEAERGNPQWDVVMMDGHGSIRGLAERDFLHTGWEAHGIELLSEYGKELLPEDLAYYPVGIHASALIAYNTDLIGPEQAPGTWEQFFAMEERVGHADPAVAAPAYPLVSAFFYQWGVEQAKQVYSDRFKQGFSVYPKNGPVGNALVSGEIAAAALQEHNAYQLKLDGSPIEVVWPKEGAPGSLRVIAISKETANLEAAQAFVEFMMKPETQNMLSSLPSNDSFFTPLAEGATSRPEREQDGAFILPPDTWSAEHETEIKTWFADQNVQ